MPAGVAKAQDRAWADLACIVYLYLTFLRISGCSTFVRWSDQLLLYAVVQVRYYRILAG